jgi:hypothetical protein
VLIVRKGALGRLYLDADFDGATEEGDGVFWDELFKGNEEGTL